MRERYDTFPKLCPESVISITERPIFHILLVVNGIFPLMSFRFMYEKSF